MAAPFVNEIDSSIKLTQWIRRQLGYPTINVEIEDQTILDNISHAISWFHRHSGDTKYRSALVLSLSAGVDTYTLGDNVLDVIDFDTTLTYGSGVSVLFTAENIMYNEGLLASSSPMELVSWELAQNYLDSVKNRFSSKFFIDFNKYKRELKVTPKPTQALVGALNVYSYWSHNITSSIFNEIWIKQYSLALTKIVLGRIYNKYSGTPIPGGGTLNGESLLTEGNTEKVELENTLFESYSEPYGFMVG